MPPAPAPRKLVLLMLLLLSSWLCACARRVPVTPRLLAAIGDPRRVQQLQFYMGVGCRLERIDERAAGQVRGGQLVYQQGRAVAVVNIPRGTPGVAVAAPAGSPAFGAKGAESRSAENPSALGVSFEQGGVLFFGARPEEGPSSPYYLLGRWDARGRFHVSYRGADYVQTSPRPCVLLVPRSVERTLVRDERTVRGQQVTP